MPYQKKPLYRKVNTTARGVSHNHGGDFADSRSRKNPPNMKKGVRRGLDYTPLFKFLLSKVGCMWDDIYGEAKSRLIEEDPIFWLVHHEFDSASDYVRVGESSYYSGMFIDTEGYLRLVDPSIDQHSLAPWCSCCTHTFNGKIFTQKFGVTG